MKRKITKEAVEHAKKIIDLYEEQQKQICPNCPYRRNIKSESSFMNYNNEVDSCGYNKFYCSYTKNIERENTCITENGKEVWVRFIGDDLSYSYKDEVPDWCVLNGSLK